MAPVDDWTADRMTPGCMRDRARMNLPRRAFAPVLGRNGGSAIVNALSVAAWLAVDGNTAYAAAKSAEWGLTNGVRLELTGRGKRVVGLQAKSSPAGPLPAFTLCSSVVGALLRFARDARQSPCLTRSSAY